MKHLIIFLIIIIGILVIKCATIESFNNSTNEYVQPTNVELKYSNQIKGRGAFAKENYIEGDIIEICPGIIQKTEDVDGKVRDYLFSYNKDNSMIGFGFCSMYNHSDSPNATWEILDKEKIKISVIKDIKAGEEIFVSYGDDYWETRTSLLDKK